MDLKVEILLRSIEAVLNEPVPPQGKAIEELEKLCLRLTDAVRRAVGRMHALCLTPASAVQNVGRGEFCFVQTWRWLGLVARLHRVSLIRAASILAVCDRTQGASAIFAFLLSYSPGDETLLLCLESHRFLPESERERIKRRYDVRIKGYVQAPEGCFVAGMACDEEGGILLATDLFSGTLHVFDMDGRWVHKHELPSSGLYGVAADCGRWWICDWSGGKIFEVEANGLLRGIVDLRLLLPEWAPHNPERIAALGETLYVQCTSHAGGIPTGKLLNSALVRLSRLEGKWQAQFGGLGHYAIGDVAAQSNGFLAATIMKPATVIRHAAHDLQDCKAIRYEQGGYFISVCSLGDDSVLLSSDGLQKLDTCGQTVWTMDVDRSLGGALSTITAGRTGSLWRLFVFQYTSRRIHMIDMFQNKSSAP